MPPFLLPLPPRRSIVGSSRGPWDGAWRRSSGTGRLTVGGTCAPTVGGLVGAWFPPRPTENPRRGTGEFTFRPAGSLVRRARWGWLDGEAGGQGGGAAARALFLKALRRRALWGRAGEDVGETSRPPSPALGISSTPAVSPSGPPSAPAEKGASEGGRG